jgi:hypothetical protein
VLTITIGISKNSMGKGKVQETMLSSAPPLMDSCSSIVMTTSSFQGLVTIVVTYTCEFFWKITGTLANLL